MAHGTCNRMYRHFTYIRESTNQHLEILIIRLTLTQLLCPVTLTSDPLTLELVHGVLVSQDSSYQVWYS